MDGAGGRGLYPNQVGIAAQHGGKLLAGDAVLGRNGGLADAPHHANPSGPGDALGIPLAAGHIGEAVRVPNRIIGQAIQHGSQRAAGHGSGHGKAVIAHAFHQSKTGDAVDGS